MFHCHSGRKTSFNDTWTYMSVLAQLAVFSMSHYHPALWQGEHRAALENTTPVLGVLGALWGMAGHLEHDKGRREG